MDFINVLGLGPIFDWEMDMQVHKIPGNAAWISVYPFRRVYFSIRDRPLGSKFSKASIWSQCHWSGIFLQGGAIQENVFKGVSFNNNNTLDRFVIVKDRCLKIIKNAIWPITLNTIYFMCNFMTKKTRPILNSIKSMKYEFEWTFALIIFLKIWRV